MLQDTESGDTSISCSDDLRRGWLLKILSSQRWLLPGDTKKNKRDTKKRSRMMRYKVDIWDEFSINTRDELDFNKYVFKMFKEDCPHWTRRLSDDDFDDDDDGYYDEDDMLDDDHSRLTHKTDSYMSSKRGKFFYIYLNFMDLNFISLNFVYLKSFKFI